MTGDRSVTEGKGITMADFSGDPEQTRVYRRFIEEIEMALRAANREIIGKQIPELNKESFFRLAVSVAKLRADYLKAVLALNWEYDGIDVAPCRTSALSTKKRPRPSKRWNELLSAAMSILPTALNLKLCFQIPTVLNSNRRCPACPRNRAVPRCAPTRP